SAPEASAASTMRSAIRSFTDPPGLKYSTLASTSGAPRPTAPSTRVTARSLTSGVLPTSSISDSWTCIVNASQARALVHPTLSDLVRRWARPRDHGCGARPGYSSWTAGRAGIGCLAVSHHHAGSAHDRGRHRRHRPLTDRARVQGIAHHRPARRPDLPDG